jgi:hypothetical protein
MPFKCPDHPNYKTGRPPKGACITCWAAYGRRRALDDGLRSRGKAKGGGQSSKAKGRAAVLLVVARLRRTLGLEDGDVFVKATSQGGCDIHLSPAAVRRFPFSPEVKNTETLNIWAALRQAELNATPGRPPILFFKRANSPEFVALQAAEFLRWLCPEKMPSST